MDPGLSPDVQNQRAGAPLLSKQYKMVEELGTDFKRKYPPDTPGYEMEDGARVWQVYRDEATANDNTILDGWNKTIDILLIFAGLCSAVATVFVIESYKLLQPDSEAYTANALYMLLNNNSALPPPPSLDTSPSPLSRWINGLWFTSLILALAVALLCILAKQWISEYSARNNASAQSPRHWARRHQVYFQAMSKWPVAEFISVLPFLLHLALFLFFAGVVAFLWTLDRAISALIIVITLLLAMFYAASTLVPLWIPDSPTSTPMVNQLRRQLMFVHRRGLWLQTSIQSAALRLQRSAARLCKRYLLWWQRPSIDQVPQVHDRSTRQSTHGNQGRVAGLGAVERQREDSRWRKGPLSHDSDPSLDSPSRPIVPVIPQSTDTQLILHRVEQNRDALDQDALMWLILAVPDTDANAVGLQSIGALNLRSPLAVRLRRDDRLPPITLSNAATRTSTRLSATEVMRIVRSRLCMQESGGGLHDISRWSALDVLTDPAHPDLGLLWSALHKEHLPNVFKAAEEWRAVSSSLTSTAILLMRSNDPMITGGIDPWAKFTTELHFLLCCQIEDLLDVQWDLLFRYLRPQNIITPPDVLRELWLINIVGRHVRSARESDDAIRAGSRIIERCLRLIARRIQDLGRYGMMLERVGKLMDLPYTTAFFSGQLDRIKLDMTLVATIAVVLHDASDVAQLNWVNILKYFNALCNLVHAHSTLDAPDNSIIIALIISACLHAFPADEKEELEYDDDMSPAANRTLMARSDRTRLAVVLEFIILPMEYSAGRNRPGATLWEMLCSDPVTVARDWLNFVERIAMSLTVQSRSGRPNRKLEERFFASLDCTLLMRVWASLFNSRWWLREAPLSLPARILRALNSLPSSPSQEVQRDPDVARIIHIVQHCIELRPKWWIDYTTSHVHEDLAYLPLPPGELPGPDHLPSLEDMMSRTLNEKLVGYGPCTSCTGTPLGWEDGMSSECSFCPA